MIITCCSYPFAETAEYRLIDIIWTFDEGEIFSVYFAGHWTPQFFPVTGIQNRDLLKYAATPGSTKFPFPLHENQKRRGTAEYSISIIFILIL